MRIFYNFFIFSQSWKIFLVYFSFLIIAGFLYFSNINSFATNSIFYVVNDLFVLLWLYSVGLQLCQFAPSNQISLRIFKIVSLLSLFFLLSFFLYPMAFNTSFTIILLNLAFAFLIFFVAKSITSTEAAKKNSADNCLGTFIYIWIFPIGIWFVQPRITKIFQK